MCTQELLIVMGFLLSLQESTLAFSRLTSNKLLSTVATLPDVIIITDIITARTVVTVMLTIVRATVHGSSL
jgi:hypothetical protein